MRTLTELNNDSKQKLSLITEDGFNIDFFIQYFPTQEGWFFDLTYGDTTINGVRLCNHPNTLRQYKNTLPFGIACTVNDGGEPYFIDDFVTERVQIHLLTATEVEQVESEILSV